MFKIRFLEVKIFFKYISNKKIKSWKILIDLKIQMRNFRRT